jgi:hypothetical protein
MSKKDTSLENLLASSPKANYELTKEDLEWLSFKPIGLEFDAVLENLTDQQIEKLALRKLKQSIALTDKTINELRGDD